MVKVNISTRLDFRLLSCPFLLLTGIFILLFDLVIEVDLDSKSLPELVYGRAVASDDTTDIILANLKFRRLQKGLN